eukprot:scaffold3219_cov105-Isochrysis_galbana.AAC.4
MNFTSSSSTSEPLPLSALPKNCRAVRPPGPSWGPCGARFSAQLARPEETRDTRQASLSLPEKTILGCLGI